MKTICPFFIVLLITFCLPESYAQVHIDAEEDVGIGTTVIDDSKVKIQNESNNIGLSVFQNFNAATSPIYGLYNFVSTEGAGTKYGIYNKIYQSVGASNQAIGLENLVYTLGSGSSTGIKNTLFQDGTGTKIGYFGSFHQNATSTRSITGSLVACFNNGSGNTEGFSSLIFSGTGAKNGFSNQIYQPQGATTYIRSTGNFMHNDGSGETIGMDTHITDGGTGHKYGVRNNISENAASIGKVYGIHNSIYLYGIQEGFGIWNRVADKANSDGVKYGIYNYVEDISANANAKYGIYNCLEKQGAGTNYALWSGVKGGGDYAGYFEGNVVVTGTVIDGVSDARLKEKTKKLEGALGLIAQLEPKSYFYKKGLGIPLPEGRQYGLIAQELEQVMPDLVSEFNHPGQPIYKKISLTKKPLSANTEIQKMIKADASENNISLPELTSKEIAETTMEIVGYERDETYKAINYQALIPVLVAAIQEQQKQLELLPDLQNIVQEQQKQLEQLKKELNQIKNK